VSTDQLNEWQQRYQAALLECDPAKLPERIEEACRAIQTYMDIAGPNCPPVERQAMADALATLRVLRREVRVTHDSTPPMSKCDVRS
jgi:hypothetical protein